MESELDGRNTENAIELFMIVQRVKLNINLSTENQQTFWKNIKYIDKWGNARSWNIVYELIVASNGIFAFN